jgi:hypothetical protein
MPLDTDWDCGNSPTRAEHSVCRSGVLLRSFFYTTQQPLYLLLAGENHQVEVAVCDTRRVVVDRIGVEVRTTALHET